MRESWEILRSKTIGLLLPEVLNSLWTLGGLMNDLVLLRAVTPVVPSTEAAILPGSSLRIRAAKGDPEAEQKLEDFLDRPVNLDAW